MKLFWIRFLLIQVVLLVLAFAAADGGKAVAIFTIALFITNALVIVMVKNFEKEVTLRVALWIYMLPVFVFLLILIFASY